MKTSMSFCMKHLDVSGSITNTVHVSSYKHVFVGGDFIHILSNGCSPSAVTSIYRGLGGCLLRSNNLFHIN